VLRSPRPPRPLALALALLALASATDAQASAAASTPTTTYVPAGATPLPSSTPRAAATTPTVSSAAGIASGQTALPPHTAVTARGAGTHLSTGAIVIAALAALLALGCAAWAIARRRALEPRWWLSLRHAIAEARFRVSATWAEFADWVRLGH
jgi:hypothetical protein